jgi:hypothetical protein
MGIFQKFSAILIEKPADFAHRISISNNHLGINAQDTPIYTILMLFWRKSPVLTFNSFQNRGQ